MFYNNTIKKTKGVILMIVLSILFFILYIPLAVIAGLVKKHY